jgi:hypothetical protein
MNENERKNHNAKKLFVSVPLRSILCVLALFFFPYCNVHEGNGRGSRESCAQATR